MEIPKISMSAPNIPPIIDDWSFLYPKPSVVNIPSIIGGAYSHLLPSIITFDAPKIPSLIMQECSKPLCISKASVPDQITIQVPNIPPISITCGLPLKMTCICLIRSPGDTYQQYLDAKERVGMFVTTEEKCKVILENIAIEEGVTENFEAFINNVYNSIRIKDTAITNEEPSGI